MVRATMSVDRLAPDLQVVLAPNPGPMTGPGTNQYLLGDGRLMLLDVAEFGDENRRRFAAADGVVERITLTHTHPDHVGGALAAREAWGAPIALHRSHAHVTVGGRPLAPERLLDDGDVIDVGPLALTVVHTPGHQSGHCCYFEPTRRWLFTGDTVLSTGTTMIGPPDGNMTDYLATLRRLQQLDAAMIFPGHGPPITDPARALTEYVAHRLEREQQIAGMLDATPRAVADLVAVIYADVHPVLFWAASLQVQAHLEKLARDGVARAVDAQRWCRAA